MAIVWEEIKMSPRSLLSICQERERETERRGEREKERKRKESGEGERWILISSGIYLCVYVYLWPI